MNYNMEVLYDALKVVTEECNKANDNNDYLIESRLDIAGNLINEALGIIYYMKHSGGLKEL